MAFCNISPNTTIPNLPFVQLWELELPVGTQYQNCGDVSYLRPDIGGAVIPWAYSILLIMIHLPTVIIRFVRWETSQSWCILLTLFSVFIYLQAYISTGLAADKVFVWTPLPLVIDAGSMLHLCILVVEEEGPRLPLLRKWITREREDFPPTQWRNPLFFGDMRSPGDNDLGAPGVHGLF
jgi:hypothetical protein